MSMSVAKHIKTENGYEYYEAVFQEKYRLVFMKKILGGNVYVKITDDFAKANGYNSAMEYIHYEEIINLEDVKDAGDIPEWLRVSSGAEYLLSFLNLN